MEDEMLLSVGNRVVVVCNHPEGNDTLTIGDTGTILVVRDGYYGVEWDNPVEDGHSLDGEAESGYGWWVRPGHIVLLDEEVEDYDMTPASDKELAALLG